LDPWFLDIIPEKDIRRPEFSKSVLVAEDKSMTDGSVGKVSGDPLFAHESSDEAPLEYPREESDITSVSGGMEEPEARFAMGCAMCTAGMSAGGNTAESIEDETAVIEIPLFGAAVGRKVRERSGPAEEKLRGLEDLCRESGRLSAEISERAESDGDKERERACGTAEVTDPPDAVANRGS
jgi:hypothetical protein